MMSVTINH